MAASGLMCTSPYDQDAQRLRVAFYGNTCNNLYQIVKMLRSHSSLDAHLFIDRESDPQERPESDDPALNDGYPSWIHVDEYHHGRSLLTPWRSPLVEALSTFDAAVVSGLGPMFAPFTSTPVAFLPAGADLTMLPFPFTFLHLNPDLRGKAWALVVGFWQRHGLPRCDEIWSLPFRPYENALRELSVKKKKVAPRYLPLVLDLDRFRKVENPADLELDVAREIKSHYDFVVFHPSRLMIRADEDARRVGNWKRNEVLLEGFARFVREGAAERPVLVMPRRSASPDVALADELIGELGIEDHVLWVRPPVSFGFTRFELVELYSVADVVADDFGAGWFGSIVLEACAIKCPVINHVDEAVMAKLYPWHPILAASSACEVHARLSRLFLDKSFGREAGARGRKWVREFHSDKKVAEVYLEQITALADRHWRHLSD